MGLLHQRRSVESTLAAPSLLDGHQQAKTSGSSQLASFDKDAKDRVFLTLTCSRLNASTQSFGKKQLFEPGLLDLALVTLGPVNGPCWAVPHGAVR